LPYRFASALSDLQRDPSSSDGKPFLSHACAVLDEGQTARNCRHATGMKDDKDDKDDKNDKGNWQ
jgi:hypothetical protein